MDEELLRIIDLFDDDEVTTADKIDRPAAASYREMFDDFNARNPFAGGGMLVQPGFDGTRQGYRKDARKARMVDTHILERKSPTTPALYRVEIGYVDPKLLKKEGYDAPRSSYAKKFTGPAFKTLKEAKEYRDKIAYPKLAKQLDVDVSYFTERNKSKVFERLVKEFLPKNKKDYITGAELAEILGEKGKFVVKGGKNVRSSYIPALIKLLDQTDTSAFGFTPLGKGLPFYMYKKPTADDIKLLKRYKINKDSLKTGTGYNFIYPKTVEKVKILDKSPFFKNFINSKQVITKDMITDTNSPLNKFMAKNNMTLNQFLRAAMRYGEALRGDFMINLTDPLLSDQSIKINKNFSNKIYNTITDSISSGFNDPIKTAIYRAAMSDISDQLGQETTTFENYKSYLRNRVRNLAGKKSGIDIDEIVGVSSSARNKTAPYAVFSRFVDSDLNQRQLRAFQKALSERTAALKSALAKGDRIAANNIVKNFETEIYKPYEAKIKAAGGKNVGLPKLTLQAPTSKTLGGGKGRIQELKKQGLDFEDFYKKEKFGYVMPKGSLTQKELLDLSQVEIKDQIRLARIGCPGKATGGRIGYFEGQNLIACATKGAEKIKNDPINLTGGDQQNLRALGKSAKAVRFLKNFLGPAAIAGELIFEGGFAANKFMSEGVPLKQALGESYINKYLLGPKTQIDVEAERAEEFAKGEDVARAERGRRMAPFMAQSATADAQRLKKREQQMEQVFPTTSPQEIDEILQTKDLTIDDLGMTYPQIQDFIKQDQQMQAIADAGGVANLAGGGIAGLSGGVKSGPPPESGPMSEGLQGLLKRGMKI